MATSETESRTARPRIEPRSFNQQNTCMVQSLPPAEKQLGKGTTSPWIEIESDGSVE